MSSPPAGEDVSTEAPSLAYRFASATFQSREYPEGVLRVNEAGSEVELRQLTGKRAETVIARFRLQPNAEVTVDGPLLRVSELSVTMESPEVAGEVADLLRRPARELEAARLLSNAEASVGRFLDSREEALDLLSRIEVDPRNALFGLDLTGSAADAEPLDAFYSIYLARVAESFESMKSSLAEGEKGLAPGTVDRLYAITYTIGAVQDALFKGDSDLAQEVAALLELGIATTAQDLRTERPSSQLLLRAHASLASLAVSRPRSS
jgi:hypothetical protein